MDFAEGERRYFRSRISCAILGIISATITGDWSASAAPSIVVETGQEDDYADPDDTPKQGDQLNAKP